MGGTGQDGGIKNSKSKKVINWNPGLFKMNLSSIGSINQIQ